MSRLQQGLSRLNSYSRHGNSSVGGGMSMASAAGVAAIDHRAREASGSADALAGADLGLPISGQTALQTRHSVRTSG